MAFFITSSSPTKTASRMYKILENYNFITALGFPVLSKTNTQRGLTIRAAALPLAS
jgi:hypothetical protein